MGRPRPVREVMALLGSSPLICMPLDASNPGKNYGTGGDFTANSAPYVGARSASEFWARSVIVPTTTSDYLSTSIGGLLDTSSVSFMFNYIDIGTGDNFDFRFYDASLNKKLFIYGSSSGFFAVVYNGVGAEISRVYVSGLGLSVGVWYTFIFVYDGTNSSNCRLYINGINKTLVLNSYAIGNILLSQSINISIYEQYAKGGVGNIYLTTTYIDFSQEVNRLKFVDGLGYPLDLKKQIDAGVIPKPLVYLPFDEPANLGKNLGTCGDFTVNGTVTAGADFSL